MKASIPTGTKKAKVINMYDHRERKLADRRLLRIAAENDGLCILYSNQYTQSDKLYSMKVLCWGLQANGDVVGIVPWLNKVSSCTDLDDPYYGNWEGYYDEHTGDVFYNAPAHKVAELEKALEYFGDQFDDEDVVQEIPDSIGTHAMLNCKEANRLILTDVLSWRLYGNGHLEAMIINEELVDETPILPGDPCLYPVSENQDFRYFFQHHIANQIKAENPAALAAIELLLDH